MGVVYNRFSYATNDGTWISGRWRNFANLTSNSITNFCGANTQNYKNATVFEIIVTPTSGTKLTEFTLHVYITSSNGPATMRAYLYNTDCTGGKTPAVPTGWLQYADFAETKSGYSKHSFTFTNLDIREATTFYVWFNDPKRNVQNAIYEYSSSAGGLPTASVVEIPLASPFTGADCDIESSTIFSIYPAAAGLTHTLTYTFGSLSGTICTKTKENSVTWTVPAEFYTQIPNSKTGVVNLNCITFQGNEQLGTATGSITVTASEAKCKPIVTGNVIDINPDVVALTGDNSILVRTLSIFRATAAGQAVNSATIAQYWINNIETANGVTEGKVTSGTFTFKVKDSRGYYATYTLSANFVDYVAPTVKSTLSRGYPASNTFKGTVSGTYFSSTVGSTENALQVTIKYKESNAAEDAGEIVLTPSFAGNSWNFTGELGIIFEYTKSWQLTITARDSFTETVITQIIAAGVPVFDWGKDDFQFNVPVYFAPNSIGTYKSWSASSAIVTPHSTATKFGSVTMSKGIWLVTAGSAFGGGTTGYKHMSLNTVDELGWTGMDWTVGAGGVSSIRGNFMRIFQFNRETTVYFYGYQNSGVENNCWPWIKAVKIAD